MIPNATLGDWLQEDLVLISTLEHYSYCPRQCALIHIEQIFDENVYTLRGRRVHEHADEPGANIEDGVRVERALSLWSQRLGLVGKADVVEFHGETPYPVEYKHGPRRKHQHDDLQLCAQAICLEEMTGSAVPRGAIFHHSSRRRREVIFDKDLRQAVEKAVVAIRNLLKTTVLPPPANDERCRNCSLIESCLPTVIGNKARLRELERQLFSTTDS